MILAIDLGTTSLRSAVYSGKGSRIPGTLARREIVLKTGPDGRAEISPAMLWRATRECLRETLDLWNASSSSLNGEIRSVGMSCFWHSFLGTDASMRPLTPVLTWADSRGRDHVAALRKRFPEEQYHADTGAMLRASFWPAKLLWLKNSNPGVFGEVSRWVSPGDWLMSRLCEDWHVGYSMASGTGLLDRKSKDWHPVWLRRCGVRKSQLGPISDDFMATRRGMASEFPELKNALWAPPIGDGAANNLGCGATEPGIAAVNFGTSAAIRVVVADAQPSVPCGLFCYLVNRDLWLVGGAISNAGNVRAWAVQNLRLPGDDALEKILTKRAPLPPELQAKPFLAAERAPDWPEDQPFLLQGATLSTDAVDLYRALTGATYERLGSIGRMLQEKVSGPFRKVVVSGGLLQSPYGMKELRRLLGCPLTPNDDPEGSLRGAALSAVIR
jgi:gluconokinase